MKIGVVSLSITTVVSYSIPSLICRPVSLSDLESLDSEFHQSMVWLKENEIDNGGSGDGGDSSSGK